ncbi:hypothetical protein Tco_0891281 [Tanacetum coccineum]|uniref:Uncharacterized protein n=1 Tax=Tanacetum coccineum TaxID=301880 RepID=A0ABQ5C7Y9_9ASTR
MVDSHNYMTEEMLDKLGFLRIDYGDFGRKMVKEVRVEIHGFTFLVDFVVIGYANEGEPSIFFGRDFLVTTKCKVDFGLGEMRIHLTMLEEERDIDALLVELVETMDEVGSTSGELVKMGKASLNKSHNVNKLTPPPPSKIEEITSLSLIAPQPVYHPLSQKQKEKIKEALDRKYKELEESKPILEVLENYMTYRKKLDEVMMGHASSCKWDGPNERLSRYRGKLLDIPIDKELSLLLGSSFLRNYGAVIDMGRGTMNIDNGVIHHTYFPKPRAKAYLENFKIDEEDDWLSCFEVGRDEDGNPKSKATPSSHPNPLIAKYVKRNNKGTINYTLQPVTNANLKRRDLPFMERHAYCERLSKFQQKSIETPRVADWTMFYVYSFDETLKELMKMEYLHDDGDVFVDYSWERALSIEDDVYPEWCLEFFSTMYFEREVDKTKLMTEKCSSEGSKTRTKWVKLELGDWNANLNEIDHKDVWRDSMLIRNNYMLKHSMPILHHLADQANFAYPTYELPRSHYGSSGDGSFEGTTVIPSSSYDVGGSSRGVHDDDYMSDPIVHIKDCVESDDDMED